MKQYKILSLLLTLALCLGLIPVTASAANQTVVEVVPCKYDLVWDFSEGFAKVQLDGKCGFVDTTGKEVIPCQYDNAERFSEGLAAVAQNENNKWGLIDATGKLVVPFKYNEGFSAGPIFCDGLAKVQLGGKYGFIDKNGKEVVPCKYTWAEDFSKGFARVQLDGKYGYVDKTGKEIAPCKYDYVWGFSGGFAMVKLSSGEDQFGVTIFKYGLIDETGKEVIPCKYDGVGDFSDGLVGVKLDHKSGFIDTTGKEVIPLKYSYARDFSDGLAQVRVGGTNWTGGKYGLIDKTGKEVVSCEYDNIRCLSEGLVAVGKDCGNMDRFYREISTWGFIDDTGKEIIPYKYTWLGDFSEGLAPVAANNGETDTPSLVNSSWGFVAILEVPTAYASTQTVNVDGRDMTFDCYALKDESGNLTNYIKLRDLAILLNGSTAQFQVGWDGNVTITTGTAYTPNGTELRTPYSGDRTYQEVAATTAVNGQTADLAAFTLQDDAGGGYTYYQLRDLGKALGFNVGWSADRGVFLETDKPYDADN